MCPPLHPCCWEGGLVSWTGKESCEASPRGSELEIAGGLLNLPLYFT